MISSGIKDTSPYFGTQIKDWYLDIWSPRVILPTTVDKFMVLPVKYERRPDLLSFDEYGTPNLWWVFCVRNPDAFIDPIEDFVAGKEFYIPPNILK